MRPTIVNNVFRDWLLLTLEEKGWSQSTLARAAGVSPAAISDALSGRRGVGKSLATKIARALRLPPEEVFRIAGILPPSITKTELIDRIINEINDLPPEEKSDVIEYIQMRRRLMEIKKKKK